VADQIGVMIAKLEALRYPTGPSRYYGLDLSICLQAGALAGSLIVASALLEVYIRGLVVRYSEQAQATYARKIEAELELEEMRGEGFNKLIAHLVDAGLFDTDDAETAKKIYREVRIPAHHGLPSRLLGRTKSDPFRSIWGLLGLGTEVSMQEFEEFVENEALPIIGTIVNIIERNQVREYA